MSKGLSNQILPTITAEIFPTFFSEDYFVSRRVVIVVLTLCLTLGFAFRVWNLGAESFSEDELNKLQTVDDYRQHGLTGRNGEHPFLMKGLQTLSIITFENLNQTFLANSPVPEEFALRFPTALFGTLTALLLFFLTKQLFGNRIGLITAILWSLDPNAIGFNRIAKEDSFLLFFFLLANCFWLYSQYRAEAGDKKWYKYVLLTAISFGAMMASKYLPHLLAITAAYYNVFQIIPGTKWRLGKYRWFVFFVTLGVSFIIFNPTILLPETWHQMLIFSGENRIGHDSYEFMGQLYPNRMTLWLAGVPWTFYLIFILVKTPLPTLILGLTGLIVFFRPKFGDGRFFIFFWLLMWFFPFSILGGKFVRYFTVAQPLIFILAAFGCFSFGVWMADNLFSKPLNQKFRNYLLWALPGVLAIVSLVSALSIAPHFRFYTNQIGGGEKNAGFYFPHDEFYDASTAETVAAIAQKAPLNATIASETPSLIEHYLAKAGRIDLISISLSDKTKVANLKLGDFIVAAKGRRYFSNSAYLNYFENSVVPSTEIKINNINSAKVYQLDEMSAKQIQGLAK